ncbi:MAG: transcriptional regulator [Saliniramus fredricksonii]|uniref:Transcriptional regulator n=2 Tax=Saliniramus fredricksonii TaxID=1653334 RepID=A0A0P7YB98_9HYPH|nr:MAG: transcriptional regulator [Saliniramus fredricksonii]SCC82042.1 DNA-binding transcriptional regulator, MarR family [Saliniramus fredricksonii]
MTDTTHSHASHLVATRRRALPEKNAGLSEMVPSQHEGNVGDDLGALVKAIRVIAQAIDTRSKAMARLSGLTIPQVVVLAGIRDLGEVTTNSLSRHVDLSPGTVVAILDKLAERGFVERYRSPTDRRIVHSRLTQQGAEILARAPSLLPDDAVDAITRMPQDDRAALVTAFRSVAGLLRGIS